MTLKTVFYFSQPCTKRKLKVSKEMTIKEVEEKERGKDVSVYVCV